MIGKESGGGGENVLPRHERRVSYQKKTQYRCIGLVESVYLRGDTHTSYKMITKIKDYFGDMVAKDSTTPAFDLGDDKGLEALQGIE